MHTYVNKIINQSNIMQTYLVETIIQIHMLDQKTDFDPSLCKCTCTYITASTLFH